MAKEEKMKFDFVRTDGREGMIVVKKVEESAMSLARLLKEKAIFSPELPDELVNQVEAIYSQYLKRKEAEAAILSSIGLVNGDIPDGYIAVHPEGIAEEYLSGHFRVPNAISVQDGEVWSRMVDYKGYGEFRQIIGITPKPKK